MDNIWINEVSLIVSFKLFTTHPVTFNSVSVTFSLKRGSTLWTASQHPYCRLRLTTVGLLFSTRKGNRGSWRLCHRRCCCRHWIWCWRCGTRREMGRWREMSLNLYLIPHLQLLETSWRLRESCREGWYGSACLKCWLPENWWIELWCSTKGRSCGFF